MLRLIGLSTWLAASLPTLVDYWHDPQEATPPRLALWLALFLGFGILFWFTSVETADLSSAGAGRRKSMLTMIALECAAALALVYLIPHQSTSILLALVAWQVAPLLPARAALALILCQTAFIAAVFRLDFTYAQTLFAVTTLLGFQLFAYVTAAVAYSEARARNELARANAELRATRELLAESSRVTERARISGELHDVLGHSLTALNIHLEVARHVAEGRALEHVRKSQALAKSLLRDVREVVSAERADGEINVRRAVETLVEGLPYPRVHLRLAEDLAVADPASAHTLLRCVQEIVTNTLRHSGAQNLWIEISREEDGVAVEARDDGRGAEALRAGQGLTSMRRRLEEAGGRLRVDARPAGGFAVNLWLPSQGGRM